MSDDTLIRKTALLTRMYDRFNARDIEAVLENVADDVIWANAMEGGHVHGRVAIRDYWTRQLSLVSPHVAPVGFSQRDDGSIVAEVAQTVRDHDGNPAGSEAQGLTDKAVAHVFRFRDDAIIRFDVEDLA